MWRRAQPYRAVLTSGWDSEKPAVQEITALPHCPIILGESCHQAGVATLAIEARKVHANGPKCQELGWSCIQLAMEAYGNRGKEARDTPSCRHLTWPISRSPSELKVLSKIYGLA